MNTPLESIKDDEKSVLTKRSDGARHVPEQYYCINWISRHMKELRFAYIDDISADNIGISQNVIYNNFIFIGGFRSGIISKKHINTYKKEYSNEKDIAGLITYEMFQQRYKEFCNPDYIVVPDYWRIVYKLRKNLRLLFSPVRLLVKYIFVVFRVLWYFGYVWYFKMFKKS